MDDSPITVLFLYSIAIVVGTVAVGVTHSWLVTVLFCSAVISWGFRLLVHVQQHRASKTK